MVVDSTNERAGVDEIYETACNASSLKVEAEKGGSGDVLIAAGWSESRLGMALLRLHSEWDGAAKPKRPSEQQIHALADSLKAQDDAERANRERENGELARLEALLTQTKSDAPGRFELLVSIMERKKLYEKGTLPLRAPTPQGKPATRARAEAFTWYRKELRLLANSLKTRAPVVEQLTAWAAIKGHDPALVAPAVHHWLSPTCVVCSGLGKRKIPDAPALSAKPCYACNGSGLTPHPQGTGRILGHMDYVTQVARNSLKKRLKATR
jgi:hypothetical protein